MWASSPTSCWIGWRTPSRWRLKRTGNLSSSEVTVLTYSRQMFVGVIGQDILKGQMYIVYMELRDASCKQLWLVFLNTTFFLLSGRVRSQRTPWWSFSMVASLLLVSWKVRLSVKLKPIQCGIARESQRDKALAWFDCSSQKASKSLPLVMKGDLVLMRCGPCIRGERLHWSWKTLMADWHCAYYAWQYWPRATKSWASGLCCS